MCVVLGRVLECSCGVLEVACVAFLRWGVGFEEGSKACGCP